MFTRYATSVNLSLLLILTVFLIGCFDSIDNDDPPPSITINTDSDDPLSPGDQMAIWVKMDTGNDPQVRWDDKNKGYLLRNTTGLSTVFTAPDEPGTYTVDVIVTIDGVATSDSVAITVVGSSPPIYEPLPPLPLAEEVIEAVRNRGYIVVGVRFDAPPFGFDANFTKLSTKFDPDTDYCLYHENFEPIGFDVNLVREFAQRWAGDSDLEVRFVPVPANKRIDCVENQRADFIAAAFTGSKCGDGVIECSQVYVQDLGDFLVRTNFEMNEFCDISGKKVAVLDGTSAEERIRKEFANACPNNPLPLFPPDFLPTVYTHRDDAIQAVKNGQADMYVTDRLILEQYTNGGDLKVAGIGFGAYEFHMAVPANHQGLSSLLNQTLQAMKYDGMYDQLYRRSKDDKQGFGSDVTPYDLKTPIPFEDLLDDVKGPIPPSPTPIASLPQSYTIKSGDTLYELARFFYGDINYFECIQNANPTIENPHRIQAGSTITIPPLEECQ